MRPLGGDVHTGTLISHAGHAMSPGNLSKIIKDVLVGVSGRLYNLGNRSVSTDVERLVHDDIDISHWIPHVLILDRRASGPCPTRVEFTSCLVGSASRIAPTSRTSMSPKRLPASSPSCHT